MSDLRPILIETIQLNADAQTFERKLVEGGDAILRCYFKQGVSPADVTGCTITAYIANAAATVVRSFSGTIIDAEGGQVDIALEGDDIDFSGDGYDFSVKLVDGDGNEIYQRLGDLEIFPKVPESATPVAGSVIDWSAFTGYTNTATDGPYRAGTNITSTTNADGSETHSLTDPPAVDGVQLNTDGALPDATGLVRWNDTDKCVEYCTVNGTIIQIGQELGTYARNSTGTLIANGQVVYVSGATGNRPTVTLAQANSFASSEKTIGLVTGASGIANNSDGFVTTFGLVRGLDTSGYSEGQELYLSPSVAGGLTATVPTGLTEFVVSLGIVTRVSPSVGEILVRPHYMGSVTGYTVNNATTTLAARTAIGAAADSEVVKLNPSGPQTITDEILIDYGDGNGKVRLRAGNFPSLQFKDNADAFYAQLTSDEDAHTLNFDYDGPGTGVLNFRRQIGTDDIVLSFEADGTIKPRKDIVPLLTNARSLGSALVSWLAAHITTVFTTTAQAQTAGGLAIKDSTGTTQATVDSTGLTLTTDLAVTEGGTGASTAQGALINLAETRVATLAGTDTLTTSSAAYQDLDPDGADRNVNLPATGRFVITNTGSAFDLDVYKSDTTTLVDTIEPGVSLTFISTGTDTWSVK